MRPTPWIYAQVRARFERYSRFHATLTPFAPIKMSSFVCVSQFQENVLECALYALANVGRLAPRFVEIRDVLVFQLTELTASSLSLPLRHAINYALIAILNLCVLLFWLI